MIDGVQFIKDNYEYVTNANDRDLYRQMYHPDALSFPPSYKDKRGADLIAFAFHFKNSPIKIKILELEGIPGPNMGYVTGLVSVDVFNQDRSLSESLLLRGSWVIVEHENKNVIRYQVWNYKDI